MTADAQDVEIVSVNLSKEKGTVKTPVPEVVIDEQGVRGDAHAGPWHRQISILAQESIDRFAEATGRATTPGEFAENITTRGMELAGVSVLDTFCADELVLEVTQIGKECHGNSCAIFREVGKCAMPSEGIFCRVLGGGTLRTGDTLRYRPRPLRIAVITLSDRASRGDYEDLSGPAVEQALKDFFAPTRWHLAVERSLLPDEPGAIRQALSAAIEAHVDVIVTTGGTGVGPRDVAPDVVGEYCEKLIPGIMESIRVTFGAENPRALLSRGIAGVRGQTLFYTLPGSVRAVEEYMGELLKTLEHLLLMLHGIDSH